MAAEPDAALDEPDPLDERDPRADRSSERRIRWDDRTGHLLEDWHLRATAAQFGHQTRAEQTRIRGIQPGLPVVILTTPVGTSAFATFNDTTSNRAKVLVGTDQERDGQDRRGLPQIGTKVWDESIVAAKQAIGDWEAEQGRHVDVREGTSPQPRKGRKVAPGT